MRCALLAHVRGGICFFVFAFVLVSVLLVYVPVFVVVSVSIFVSLLILVFVFESIIVFVSILVFVSVFEFQVVWQKNSMSLDNVRLDMRRGYSSSREGRKHHLTVHRCKYKKTTGANTTENEQKLTG